jgi:1-acyl-sn-glycerol-3-phosphate acyltransferase
MSIVNIIKNIIIIIVFLICIVFYRTDLKSFLNFFLNYFNVSVKVKGIENLKKYKNTKLLIMSNHHSGLDYVVISFAINYYTNDNKKIYTIVKHNIFGDNTDNNMVSNFLGLFKDRLYNFFNFLPYVRDDKDSGDEIKKMMLDVVKKNNTVLLFPEGESTREGIPKAFKPGSFRLCTENDIWILPISLKFNKIVGVNRKDPVCLNDWHNVIATVIIHEPIFDKNWKILKDKVFNIIRTPLID